MARFKHILGVGAAAVFALSAIGAMAQSTPFMKIRFNQPRMYYEQPLYNAVARAVSLKPDVMFDLVSVAPRTGDSSLDREWQERSRTNTQEVVRTLNALGVPSSRLTVSQTQQDGLRYDEVWVSAR